MADQKVELRLRFGEHTLEIAGDPDTIVREVLRFFSKVYPQLELLSKLTLTIDLEELMKASVGILALAHEGVVITANTETLKDQECILVQLVRSKLAFTLSGREKDTMMTDEIASSINGKPGTVAGRLSELVSSNLIERVGKGEYRITTMGLDFFVKDIVPALKQMTMSGKI